MAAPIRAVLGLRASGEREVVLATYREDIAGPGSASTPSPRRSVALLVLPWIGFPLNTWLGALIGVALYGRVQDLRPCRGSVAVGDLRREVGPIRQDGEDAVAVKRQAVALVALCPFFGAASTLEGQVGLRCTSCTGEGTSLARG